MSEARSRLLSTATGLFYAEGIRAVGVDRVIAEAQVTRATLYRHFQSKDDLIVAYLTQADEAIREQVNTARAQDASPADIIRAVSRSIASAASRHCDSQLRGKRKVRSAPPTRRSDRHMPGVAASRVQRAVSAGLAAE